MTYEFPHVQCYGSDLCPLGGTRIGTDVPIIAACKNVGPFCVGSIRGDMRREERTRFATRACPIGLVARDLSHAMYLDRASVLSLISRRSSDAVLLRTRDGELLGRTNISTGSSKL